MDKKLKNQKILSNSKNNSPTGNLADAQDKLNEEIYNLLLEMHHVIQNSSFTADLDIRYVESIASKYSQKLINISNKYIILNLTK